MNHPAPQFHQLGAEVAPTVRLMTQADFDDIASPSELHHQFSDHAEINVPILSATEIARSASAAASFFFWR